MEWDSGEKIVNGVVNVLTFQNLNRHIMHYQKSKIRNE